MRVPVYFYTHPSIYPSFSLFAFLPIGVNLHRTSPDPSCAILAPRGGISSHDESLWCDALFIILVITAPLSCRESKISHSERVQCGVTGEQLWLKINEPTEKDKGKYAMDIFDGQSGVKRIFDLSGQGGSTRGLSA